MQITKIIILLVLLNITLLANSVATVTAIKGNAFLQRDLKNIAVNVGIKLEKKDSIITQDRTKVQIIFNDNTIITIGENSNFSISEYLFDETDEPEISFALLKGAMRTITGKIGKIAPERFSVKTKTATIGIRGTNFTIIAGADDVQQIYCTYGAINVYVEGESFIVHQGFLLGISPNLESEIRAFSAKDLKDLNDANFGKSLMKKNKQFPKPLTTKVILMDNTTQDNSDRVISSVLESQKQAADRDTHEDLLTYIPVDVPVDTPVDVPVDAPVDIPVIGRDIDEFSFGWLATNSDEVSFLALNLPNDLTKYGGETNMIIRSNYNFEIDTLLEILSFPTTYNENFETTFVAVKNYDNDNTLLSVGNLEGGENRFSATADDLSPTDSMHWGSWSVAYTIDQKSKNSFGLWTAGNYTYNPYTESSIVSSYTSSADYSGIYKAATDGIIVNGSASLHVDFGADTASLNINHPDSSSSWATYSMGISDDSFLAGLQNGTTSGNALATGTFYGETGDSVGGAFTIENGGSVIADGVYQVHTDQVLH